MTYVYLCTYYSPRNIEDVENQKKPLLILDYVQLYKNYLDGWLLVEQ